MRNLTEMTDPAGHTTRYGYYADGACKMGSDTIIFPLYDARGRLSQVNDGTKTAIVYTYDYQHRRTRRSPGGQKYGSAVVYHYDTGGHLIAETTPAGAPLRSYVWRDDTVAAQIEHQPARAVLYLESDYLGAVRAARNSAGQVVWRWESDAFGALSADTDPDRDRRNTTVNLRFPGQIADEVNPTVYNWHRYYEPSSGRYITSDPIGLAGGVNTYAYVESNPARFVDPFGLYQMCHRPVEIFPGRHCYGRFHDGSTSSFGPNGVGPEKDPGNSDTVCTDPEEPEMDECIKNEMNSCKKENYRYSKFNCCHCLEQALKACGTSIPASSWPNWPINPGPQPGEPGYSPLPIYNPSLGK